MATESRPETVSILDVENPAEAEISAPTSVRRGFGTTKHETAAEVMPRDKPEVVPTFPLY